MPQMLPPGCAPALTYTNVQDIKILSARAGGPGG